MAVSAVNGANKFIQQITTNELKIYFVCVDNKIKTNIHFHLNVHLNELQLHVTSDEWNTRHLWMSLM